VAVNRHIIGVNLITLEVEEQVVYELLLVSVAKNNMSHGRQFGLI
jgi:hypothetical protein